MKVLATDHRDPGSHHKLRHICVWRRGVGDAGRKQAPCSAAGLCARLSISKCPRRHSYVSNGSSRSSLLVSWASRVSVQAQQCASVLLFYQKAVWTVRKWWKCLCWVLTAWQWRCGCGHSVRSVPSVTLPCQKPDFAFTNFLMTVIKFVFKMLVFYGILNLFKWICYTRKQDLYASE